MPLWAMGYELEPLVPLCQNTLEPLVPLCQNTLAKGYEYEDRGGDFRPKHSPSPTQ